MTSRGTPSPAANTAAPSRMSASTSVINRSGIAVSRSTPSGLSVSAFAARISATISSPDIVDAPKHPNPPASDTAATSAEYETPPMPASITGCSMPRTSVSRVCMEPPRTTGGRE